MIIFVPYIDKLILEQLIGLLHDKAFTKLIVNAFIFVPFKIWIRSFD